MRRVLVFVLAVTAGCPAPKPASLVEPTDNNAFEDATDFKPKSFDVVVSGEGRPIIYIPGLGCPGEMWQESVDHFDGYQSHVLTLAGFAGLPRINAPIGATVRKELVRYIRSRKLKNPIIMGHSLGGFIAYWLAATAPEVVGDIVVVDAGPALSDTDVETATELRHLWTQAEDVEFDSQVRNLFNGMITDPKRLAPFMDTVAKSDRRALGDAIYEVVTTDLRDDMTKIQAPVLVVLADGGLQQQIRTQVEPIPDHDVKVIPKARHFVMLDDPKAFFKVVDEFLEAH